MTEFAQLDGDHLIVLVVLAGIAAMTLVGIAWAIMHARRASDVETTLWRNHLAGQLDALIDHASDAYAQHELSSATLDQIASTLDKISEHMPATGESINLALHPDLKPWPES